MKSITAFWNWVSNNETILRNLQSEKPQIQKLYFFWLEKHLLYYSEGINCILIFPKNHRDHVELIISANGNREYFAQVLKLLEDVPSIPFWKFTAFIQPQESIDKMETHLEKPYVFKDIHLKASEYIYMTFEYDGIKKINMIVYLKNFTVYCNNKNLPQVIFITMNDIIGENFLYRNINFVEIAQIPEEDSGLIYLYDFQFFIDKMNLSK